jgi:hypothetical protein
MFTHSGTGPVKFVRCRLNGRPGGVMGPVRLPVVHAPAVSSCNARCSCHLEGLAHCMLHVSGLHML